MIRKSGKGRILLSDKVKGNIFKMVTAMLTLRVICIIVM
jgi:hypothetical protein